MAPQASQQQMMATQQASQQQMMATQASQQQMMAPQQASQQWMMAPQASQQMPHLAQQSMYPQHIYPYTHGNMMQVLKEFSTAFQHASNNQLSQSTASTNAMNEMGRGIAEALGKR